MKKIIALLVFLVLHSVTSAEVLTRTDYKQGVIKTSQRSAEYNAFFSISATFHGSYNTLTDQNGIVEKTTKPLMRLEIVLKHKGDEMPEEIQLTSDKFIYQIVGEPMPKFGSFSEQFDGMSLTKGTGRYSIYGNNENGYGVQQHYEKWYKDPSFLLEHPYPYPNPILQKPFSASFAMDLYKCIVNGTEMIIQIPYANNKHNITEQKYITFKITKDTLAEWKDVSGFEKKP